jgi:putative ABC transport system substrate-binding protein
MGAGIFLHILFDLIKAASERPPSLEERPQKIMRLGLVGLDWPSTALCGVDAFWERLRELGWIRGQNLVVEERGAHGRMERLPALMSEVIAQNIDILFTYDTPAAIAAKNATRTIPIVAAWIGDALEGEPATSLSDPGENLTGISLAFAEGFSGKWLQLLRETVPQLSTVAVIANPASPWVGCVRDELEGVAGTQGLTLRFIEVGNAEGFDPALYKARRKAQAALVLGDPLTMHDWRRIQYDRMPTMYTNLEFAQLGGLMAYGVDAVVVLRRAADYVEKILRGAKPGDLPIEQSAQYKLIVNLKTAKALGISIPQSILLQADEVIR